MTAQIINFNEYRSRRTAEQKAKQLQSPEVQMLVELFKIAASAVMDEQQAEQKPVSHYTPAYCLPENEVKGDKYDSTRNQDIAEIAKLIRKDIKVAQNAGEIPAGVKCSVRIQRYSMGQSLYVTVTEVPESFRVHTPEFSAVTERGTYYGKLTSLDERIDRYTDEAEQLLEKLKSIVAAYNRDNSDSQVDYFERRFYGDTSYSSKVERNDFEKY